MSYLRNKQNNKLKPILLLVCVILIVVLFHVSIFKFLSKVLQSTGRFIWGTTNSFKSKDESRLAQLEAKLSLYDTVIHENILLKDIFYRASNDNFILASILAKPSMSPFDTLIIDVGLSDGILVGQNVFAYGDVFLGKVDQVYNKTSVIKLFSSPGETTDTIISGKDIFIQAVGRGGQNFEITVPQNIEILKGTQIILPGLKPYILGLVEEIISDPREPFQKLLIHSPINIQEVKFVQIEK